MDPEPIEFYAMPDSPHLTHSWCGYMLITLPGLSLDLTSDQVEKITINGYEQKWKPLGQEALMIIPSFRQEAQRVQLHLRPSEALKQIKLPPYREFNPDLSMGLGKAHNRFQRRD